MISWQRFKLGESLTEWLRPLHGGNDNEFDIFEQDRGLLSSAIFINLAHTVMCVAARSGTSMIYGQLGLVMTQLGALSLRRVMVVPVSRIAAKCCEHIHHACCVFLQYFEQVSLYSSTGVMSHQFRNSAIFFILFVG